MRKMLFTVLVFFAFMSFITYLESILKEPEYISDKPQYAKLILPNDEQLVLVLDKSSADNGIYDVMHADINFNNDLTDDQKYESDGNNERYDFKFNINTDNHDYSLRIRDFSEYSLYVSCKTEMKANNEKWTYVSIAHTNFKEDFKKAVPLMICERNADLKIDLKIIKRG